MKLKLGLFLPAIATVLFLLGASSETANAQVPTQSDLEATISKWNDFIKPGQVMVTKSDSPVFLLSDDLFSEVEKAYAIGDREIVIGLAKQGKAFVEAQKVRVRLTGSGSITLCPAYKTLRMECTKTELGMREQFRQISLWNNPDRRYMKNVGITEAKRQDFLAKLAKPSKAFLQHDIGSFVEDEYAKVRVLDGAHVGEEGLIKFSELIGVSGN